MGRLTLTREIPELTDIQTLVDARPAGVNVEILTTVQHGQRSFPIYQFEFGKPGAPLPTFFLVGGVHGLERIGTRVVNAFLRTIISLLSWDDVTRQIFERVRLVAIPLLNPVGMYLRQRSNGNGVDLMRNAPIDAEVSRWSLVGGHRLSPMLPWFRGRADQMEQESQALCNKIEEYLAYCPMAMALDVHSGFGVQDRLWFPYARTKKPFPHIAQVYSLVNLLNLTYPNHIYKIEPQSFVYTTHGDLWDYLYDRHEKKHGNFFLPLTLELGSWLWVKKNPRQLLSPLGIFNPVIPHRMQRILRRHLLLIDFLLRATASHDSWDMQANQTDSAGLQQKALAAWYPRAS